jgi:leucine-zipper-like transcriptional regulator 1
MKKAIILMAVIIIFLIAFGCKKTSPSGDPPSTHTSTSTITSTVTSTPTPTYTPTFGPGSNWTKATSSSVFGVNRRQYHSSAVYDSGTGLKMWVIGGHNEVGNFTNDVWNSSDGATWNLVTGAAAFSARSEHTSVDYNDGTGNKIWVIGGWGDTGFMNDIWNSSDGVTWNPVTGTANFLPRSSHTSVVFDNGSGLKMWVIGGGRWPGPPLNDVWSSSDGITWTLMNSVAYFSGRSNHASAVFFNKIWVIGGLDASMTNLNDVWSSSDGITWVRVTAHAPFSARRYLSALVFNNKMYIIGGYDGNRNNDVWVTDNGADWAQMLPGTLFPQRAYNTSAVFNSKMWIMAGDTGIYPIVNDVWWSQ